MKICIITRFLYPEKTGGAEIFSNMLAFSLAEEGHEVHVITQQTKGFVAEQTHKGLHIHRVKYPLFFGLEVYPLGATWFFAQALVILKKVQPDIIHAFQTSFCGSFGFFLSRLLRIKLMINDRGSFFTLPEWYRTKIAPLFLKRAQFVVVNSTAMKENMDKVLKTKRQIDLIQNGVILKNYSNHSSTEAKRLLDWDPEERAILFVGRLHEVKGPIYLVKAMKDVVDQGKEKLGKIPVLRMVGDGSQREEVEKLIRVNSLSEWIRLEGNIPKNMLPLYFNACDLVVIPSTSDSFPNVALEALASGKPVVGSRVGGIPEIVEEGVNGLLAPPGDHQQLARHIITLLQDRELYKKMSVGNREKAPEFAWTKVTRDFQEMYRRT